MSDRKRESFDWTKIKNYLCPPKAPATSISVDPAKESSNQCPICLHEMFDRTIVIEGCKHDFCYGCITRWTKVNAVCPLCKAPISKVCHNLGNGEGVGDIVEVSEFRVKIPNPNRERELAATERAIREQLLLSFNDFSGPGNVSAIRITTIDGGAEMEDYRPYDWNRTRSVLE